MFSASPSSNTRRSHGVVQRRFWLIIAVALLLMVVPVGASSADTEPAVLRQGWAPEGTLVTFAPQEGHLYASARAGQPEARIGIELDHGTGPAGTLAGATLEVTEADDSFLAQQAELVACALEEPLPGSGELEQAPAGNCRLQVPVTRDGDGTWRTPLDVFIDHWHTAPVGVVVLARPTTPGASWRVSFDANDTSLHLPAQPSVTPSENSEDAPPSGETSDQDGSAPTTTDVDPLAAPPVATPATSTTSVAPVDQQPAPTSPREDGGATGGVESVPVAGVSGFPDADHPPSFVVLLLVALALAVVFSVARKQGTTPLVHILAGKSATSAVPTTLAKIAVAGLVLLAPLAASEVTLFRVGLVLITMIAAMGLHVLVNWTGELSLAHAGMIGLPAFTMAKLSADQNWSPLVLLPVAVLIGATVGSIIGLPALRSRGLQVALVTLAAGLAIERFFFTKPWLIGAAGGVNVAEPTLGPVSLASTRSLYPLIVLAFLATMAAMWAIYRSKIARAWLWIRNDPDAASVFGIPVSAYRVLAYTVAGGIAGFAGGLTGVWVQRLTPQTFPSSLSFIYLVIVVVGGRGFVGGVLAAAALLEGGRLFFSGADVLIDYGGPIALILVLTRYRTGLNGIWRQAMTNIRNLSDRAHHDVPERRTNLYTVQFCVGVSSVVLGFVAIALAWYHAGNTDQVWIQNQELLSGGVGGIAAVLLGAGLLIRDQIAKSQAEIATRLDGLVAQREVDNGLSGGDPTSDSQPGHNGTNARPRRTRQLEATR